MTSWSAGQSVANENSVCSKTGGTAGSFGFTPLSGLGGLLFRQAGERRCWMNSSARSNTEMKNYWRHVAYLPWNTIRE
jgi:hypothetical protein